MDQIILGITCDVKKEAFPDGKRREVYTFTVPGWEPCSVTGRQAAKRVIRARLDPAVRRIQGIEGEEER